LEKELFTSKVLADDILKFGEENGINLLGVAIDSRCIHEWNVVARIRDKSIQKSFLQWVVVCNVLKNLKGI